MHSFAIYRKPYDTVVTLVKQLHGTNTILDSAKELDHVSGFLVAPFDTDALNPIVVINGDNITHYDDADAIPKTDIIFLDRCCEANVGSSPEIDSSYAEYLNDFDKYHAALLKGEFVKLVLARQKTEPRNQGQSAVNLFVEACRRYPRLFIALHTTPISGTWLIASPELLLDTRDGICHTMALAGTMRYDSSMDVSQWSEKNIQEQALVTNYINEVVRPDADCVSVYGPQPVRAGHLMHLRTDFTFSLRDGVSFGELVDRLSPTPAVCGIPKDKAKTFIIENEHTDRGYYSGYCGPVEIEGYTSLYVSLRCMRIFSHIFQLYAGGGLLPDSEVQSEWYETEYKMQTMGTLINDSL